MIILQKFISIGDIYINDAFSCSHRKQASIHKITKYIKNSLAGPLFMKEILSINMILNNKKIQLHASSVVLKFQPNWV